MNINIFTSKSFLESNTRYEFIKEIQSKLMVNIKSNIEIKIFQNFDDDCFLNDVNLLYIGKNGWKLFFDSNILHKINIINKIFIISSNPKFLSPNEIFINNLAGIAWDWILKYPPNTFSTYYAHLNRYAYDNFFKKDGDFLPYNGNVLETSENYETLGADTDLVEKISSFLELYISNYNFIQNHIDDYVLYPTDNKGVMQRYFKLETLSLENKQVIEQSKIRFYTSQSFEERAKEVNIFF